MSTTVTYKGNTIATVNNQTKVLNTAGKYMEGDVTLQDVTAVPTGNIDIDDSGVFDVTQYATATVPELEYEAHHQFTYRTQNNQRRCDIEAWSSVDEPGFCTGGSIVAMDTWLPAVAANTTVTPTESAQTVGGSDYMMEGAVTVSGIPSNYVGSGVTQRSSTDLTASGATVTAPAGYYASSATKTVASGTEGTPTASKGTVSNHSVSVTPSVTNSAGYISGGTKTGTAVTVSASELVSGTLNVTSSGTKDVTNYASASVPAGTEGTPTATKGTVSNNSVSVTPSVTNTAGYISGGTKTGTAVTVSASELVSGSQTITQNGTVDVTNLEEIVVAVSGGGDPSYTLTTIIDTTVTPSGETTNIGSGTLVAGAHYLVTVNDTKRINTAVITDGNLALSDQDYNNSSTSVSPWIDNINGNIYFSVKNYNSTFSVKIEKLELNSSGGGGGGGSTLIEKSITANGTYNASDDSADGYSKVTVNVSGGSVNIGTATTTNSSNQNTSISFTLPAGRTPKAFFCRLTSQIARNSNSRYYYCYDMRWDGSSTGGVAGNTFYMSSGTLTNVTSGYSYSQSGTTFTLSSTGSRSASPGSFFNGTYELVYVY